jgi:hypothetical protein
MRDSAITVRGRELAKSLPNTKVRVFKHVNINIKPTLIWYSVVEYLPFSNVQFKSEGAVKHKSDQSDSVEKDQVDYLLQKAMNSADFYATRTQNYLIAYSNRIPQYLQSIGNQTEVYPDMGNAYFGGINL